MRVSTFLAVAFSVSIIVQLLVQVLTEHIDVVRGSSSVFSVSRHATGCFWQDELQRGYGQPGDGAQPGYGLDGAQDGYGGLKDKLKDLDITQGLKDELKDKFRKDVLANQPPRQLCGAGTNALSKKVSRRSVTSKQLDDLAAKHPKHVETAGHCMTHGMDLCMQICGMTTTECTEASHKCIKDACKGDTTCEKEVNAVSKPHYDFWDLPLTQITLTTWDQMHCDCIPDSKADKARHTELTSFYKEWAPDQPWLQSKVDIEVCFCMSWCLS